VHVEIAPEVGALDQARQGVRGRGLDLAAHFAQLSGGTKSRPRAGVDVLFVLAGDAAVVVDAEQSVFVQLESRGRFARSRSAMLCALDPVKYCIAAPPAFRRRRAAGRPGTHH